MTFARARTDMIDELIRLGGVELVLSSNLALRPDGLPYADNRPITDPGVACYFTRDGERLCIACDTYSSVEANIRGIGLSIEALRALDRHGSSHMVRAALVGFRKELPAVIPRSWWDVLCVSEDADPGVVRKAYEHLALTAHPDRGGNDNDFHVINSAWETFKRTKGL